MTNLVEKLFGIAADLPKGERGAFLDQNCGADPALRGEVESLLAQLEEPTADYLKTRAPGGGPGLGEQVPGEMIADRYKLNHVLGEGGLGIVWLAMQKHPVPRRVALKLIKPGMGSKEILGRFEVERNALAIMDHPNIARVLDAGMTEMGQPFFAMEFVEGVTVTEFCDTECLPTEDRLRVFMQICSAVQHAHQKGIIHRDLKPSNILVTLQEGKPVPKVIDFGIAKATTQELTEATIFTIPGQMIGTPEYMSPEQAELSAVGVDSTTDIYSLGVVLYELLTGELPFSPGELRQAGLAEIQRKIREDDPPKPSTRVSDLGARTSRISSRRGTDPRTLRSQLKGDLDWIVMKALEKQRTRRYSSASEFAADVERFLKHEPVLARRPSRAYKFRKFAQRNRTGVVAGAIVLVTLLAGVIGTTLAMLEADRLRRKSDAAAASARASTQAMADLIGLANIDLTRNPNLTMRDLLIEARKLVDSGTLADPAAEATVRGAIGKAYYTLGEFRTAGEQIRRAIEIHEARGESSPELYDLRWVNLWIAYDEVSAVAPQFQEALSMLVTGSLAEFGRVSQDLRGMMLEIYKQTTNSPYSEDGEQFRFLEFAPPGRDDYVDGPDGTQKLIRDFVARARECATPEEPHFWPMVADQFVLAGWTTVFQLNRVDDGIQFVHKAIEIYLERGNLSDSHTRVTAARRLLWEIGWVFDRGKMAMAELERTLRSTKGVAPKSHWYVSWCQVVLAALLLKDGQTDRGRELASQGFPSLVQILEEDDPKVREAVSEYSRLGVDILGNEIASVVRPLMDRSVTRALAVERKLREEFAADDPRVLAAITEILHGARYWDYSHRADAQELERDLKAVALQALAATDADPEADARRLCDAAWFVVIRPDHDEDAYHTALRCAKRFIALDPSHYHLNTLGVTQYRAKDYPGSISTLKRAIRVRGWPEPLDLAFQAMAEFRIGDEKAWRATMAAMEELMKLRKWQADTECQNAWREARNLCR